MRESRAAIRYAKAVLNASLEANKADRVHNDMQLIASTIKENNELQLLLSNPVIKAEAKKDTLVKIFGEKIDNISLSLINLLIRNKRLPLLAEVTKQYAHIYNQYKGRQVAEVTTAIPLTSDLEKKVLSKAEAITGKKISLKSTVDPSIIGGFILRVGDRQFDASIQGKINSLRRAFETNTTVTIE